MNIENKNENSMVKVLKVCAEPKVPRVDAAKVLQRAWRKFALRTFRENLDNDNVMSQDKTVMKWIREGNGIIEHDYFGSLDENPGQENVSDKEYYDAFLDRVEESEEEVEEALLDELPLKVRMLLTHLY
jgi:hypothetical protein